MGADKSYHQQKAFVAGCRERHISPHVSCKEGVHVGGLDRRTTESAGCQTSLRIRKRVEEIFGWIKTVGGLRRSRYLGIERTQAWAYFVAGTYNLLRMANLGLVCRPAEERDGAAGVFRPDKRPGQSSQAGHRPSQKSALRSDP